MPPSTSSASVVGAEEANAEKRRRTTTNAQSTSNGSALPNWLENGGSSWTDREHELLKYYKDKLIEKERAYNR